MIGAVTAGFEQAYNLFAPKGATDRIFFNLYCFFRVFSPANSSEDQNRVAATVATLSLNGRLSRTDSFAQWIKKSYPEGVQEDPASLLVSSQVPDLITKVVAATAFYFTRNLSFYDSMTNLLAHSEKVSKVAQPILDKAASLPIPYLLQATRVIAFAPVIIKLIHIQLISKDPKGENKALNLLKTGADKTAQGLEVLWNLRFSLLCLGISTTVYRSVFLTISWLLLDDRVFSSLQDFFPKVSFTQAQQLLQLSILALSRLFNYDIWPTTGLHDGLKALLASLSLQVSSDPCDKVLEELFNQANNLQKGTLDNLDTFKTSIDTIKSDISSALKSKKITPSFASNLLEVVGNKISKTLSTIVLDLQFEAKITEKKFLEQFKATFCQKLNEEETTQLVQLLTNLKQIEIPNGSFQDNPQIAALQEFFSSKSTFELRRTCATFLWSEVKKSYEAKIISQLKKNLPYQNISDLTTLHEQLTEIGALGCPEKSVNELRSEIFKSIYDSYPVNLKLKHLCTKTNDSLPISHEKQLMNLFGTNKFLRYFAVTKKEQDDAYLLSAKFHVQRFELNLNEYLQNPPANPQKRKEIEYGLLSLAQQAKFDIKRIEQFQEFVEWKSKQPQSNQKPDQDLAAYLKQSKLFDFARTKLQIPPQFKFETVGLPGVINVIKGYVNQEALAVPEVNFPAQWTNETELSKAVSEDVNAMYEWIKKGSLQRWFERKPETLSSKEIQRLIQLDRLN